ncbi:MAG: chromosome segregation protein SMC, partial [Bradyrhizobium sp.]
MARLQAVAAYELPPLRDAEQAAASELQKLILARETLDGEEKRARSRIAELERRLAQMNADLAREQSLIEDAASVLGRLDAEAAELGDMSADDGEAEQRARENLSLAETSLAASDKALGEAQTAFSTAEAQRATLAQGLRNEAERLARFETELEGVRSNLARLRSEFDTANNEADLRQTLEAALAAAKAAEENMVAAEAAHAGARETESRVRGPLQAAEREAQRRETEAKTLSNLLSAPTGGSWTPIVEEISVAKGYEAALGAALG